MNRLSTCPMKIFQNFLWLGFSGGPRKKFTVNKKNENLTWVHR